MIRVLIVEDQRMAREDMENYIQSSGRYCLAASITNAAMAETVCRQSRWGISSSAISGGRRIL